MSHNHIRHETIEQRLRDALLARADSIGHQHLRPTALPTGPGRLLPRAAVIALIGLAAAVVCLLLVLTSRTDGQIHPADTPSHSATPATSQAPASPAHHR
jgi:hypothetical protein